MSDPDADTATDPSDFLALMGHLYRGELGRTTTWRSRLDRTTNWAVVLTATLLTWSFSAEGRPHFVLLAGTVMVALFLLLEAHRYRIFNVWRRRVRFIERNVMAMALDERGGEPEWRDRLGVELRTPEIEMRFPEALAHRLRRIYLPLFSVLLAAWLAQLTVFEDAPVGLVRAARIGQLPGSVVLAAVAVFYAAAVLLTLWPEEQVASELL